jgi:hypothetical protein
VSLSNEIGDFGGLVGLLLALATLLTANRAAALAALRNAANFTPGDKWREAALSSGLATVSTLVFLGGLPLAVRAAAHLHPLAHGGPLRSVFVLSWVLLAALLGWQLSLARGAVLLKPPA